MAENKNAENKSQKFITKVSAAENTIVTSIVEQMENRSITLDPYSIECAMNAVSAINALLYKENLTWNSEALDPSNYQDIIKKTALLKLNANASNREVYFQFRKVKIGEVWKTMVEMGIEGDGNDAVLRNFGVDVETVFPFWNVRENDDFEFPTWSGLEMTPPRWTPKGSGKTIRVVYPVKLKNGTATYLIAEREDVVRNLHAHIMNNMMNETFGICANRYKATDAQKSEIDKRKREIRDKIKNLSLDELLDCEDVQSWISPSWSEPHSREAMILRKMRNNAIKKFPKDFGSSYALDAYNTVTDETASAVVNEINTEANTGEFIDADFSAEDGGRDGEQVSGSGD